MNNRASFFSYLFLYLNFSEPFICYKKIKESGWCNSAQNFMKTSFINTLFENTCLYQYTCSILHHLIMNDT